MNNDKQNTVPNIHDFAEQYRKRVSMEMFGHENATSAEVIEYGHEKSRKESSLKMFGHENATMREMVVFERRVKLTILLNDVTATLLALRQFREDKFDMHKALAVYASSKVNPLSNTPESKLVTSEQDLERSLFEMNCKTDGFVSFKRLNADEIQLADVTDPELVISENDLDRLLMEMKWVTDAFVRELQVGIHYRVHDDDLISKLYKSLAQIRSLNSNRLPSFLIKIEDLVLGKH